MSLVIQLIGFGLRQVIGDGADTVAQVVGAVEQRFRDHSRTLPRALEQAHNRAWQALGVALAGDGLLDRIKVFFASGDDKGVREQVQGFLTSNAVSFDGAPDDFRQTCLDELKRLRKSGRLATQGASAAEIARQTAAFQRHADPQGLIEESRRAVSGVADALAGDYPNLSRLLRTPTPSGPPLLAAAFCYFFRREVETDDELAHGLFFDGLRQLSASQAKAFAEVSKALTSLGGQFDTLFEQLGRIETVVEETHGAVLDLQAEMQRLGGLHLANVGEMRILGEQVQHIFGRLGMARGEVRPGDSCSIRGEDERRAVKALLAQFRQLPAEEQRKVPALLNGLGKLQVGAGEFAEARQIFTEVVQVVGDPSAKAEAFFNAYQAALEERRWDEALDAIRQAAFLDAERFTPFPLNKYVPHRILGAGGFGVTFLCRYAFTEGLVAVKALATDKLARSVKDVFQEAAALDQLHHSSIVRLRECGFADEGECRPYLVMDYFDGVTLEEYVAAHGPLAPEELPSLARPLAQALQAAHSRGVWHRDVKPANVLLRRDRADWHVRLIDFGLAIRHETDTAPQGSPRSLRDKSVAGTVDYASPEQMGQLPGEPVSPRSDVYGFGKTCCYALFGRPHLGHKEWDSLSIPLRDLLDICVAKLPGQRLQDFAAVLARLDAMYGLMPGEVRRFKGHDWVDQGWVDMLFPSHKDWWPVNTLVFSPDSRWLLSGGRDKTIRQWEVETGKELLRIQTPAPVFHIAPVPGSRRVLACGDEGELRLWDLQTGTEVRRFTGHGGLFGGNRVYAVDVSPNGRFALSGGADRTIRLWQLNDGREVRRFTGHSGTVLSVAFSPDGSLVLSGDDDDSVRLWNVATAKQLRGFHVRDLLYHAVKWIDTNRLTSIRPHPFTTRMGRVFQVGFLSGGRHGLSAHGDGTMRVWDLQTGKELRRISDYWWGLGDIFDHMTSAASAGNGRIVSGGSDGVIKLWSDETGAKLCEFRGSFPFAITCLALSVDGRLVASGTGGMISLWALP